MGRARLIVVQFSSYFVGYQEHRELRTAAEKAWADQFTLQRYHVIALPFGSPPMRCVKTQFLDERIPK
jgi:uncharacterized protein (DUF885 family)